MTAPRVAVIGAGPAGFYAVEALLRGHDCARIDLFERLLTPYGLVRSGVAPDHPKLKSVTKVFDRIARDDRVRFFGNVTLGRDIELGDLRTRYSAVIIACGTPIGNKPGIDGEDQSNCVTAGEFVGWYNGHPDHAHHNFDLTCSSVAVVGNGNVALDIARILAKPTTELWPTDIATHALDALAKSEVKDIHVVGRRGPVDASFSSKELREFNELTRCISLVDSTVFRMTEEQLALREKTPELGLKLKCFETMASRSADQSSEPADRRCHFHFHRQLLRIVIGSKPGLLRLELDNTTPTIHRDTQDEETQAVAMTAPEALECGLVIFSIGYRASTWDDLPTNSKTGIVENVAGRVVLGEDPIQGVYVTGWLKRGPSGVIGTNKADSQETVDALLEDLPSFPQPTMDQDIRVLLEQRGIRVIDFNDWLRISASELSLGETNGRGAVKYTTTHEMLQFLDKT